MNLSQIKWSVYAYVTDHFGIKVFIDAMYEKSTARGAGRRKVQLATRERRVAQLKILDEEKHDSDEGLAKFIAFL